MLGNRYPILRSQKLKRFMDLVGSIVGILFFSPAMLAIAVLIRVHMGPPIFFRQKRPGLKGKPFAMYKFRTMLDLRDGDGALLPDRVRLTKLGKFLRATSLDELPELFNVLKGDMSLVGPRPLLMKYLDLYSP